MPLRPFSILLPFVTCTNVQLQPPFSSPITFFSQEKHFCSVMISWSFWFQLRFRGLSLLSFFSQERDSVLISWFLLVSAQVLRLASLPFLSFLFSRLAVNALWHGPKIKDIWNQNCEKDPPVQPMVKHHLI